MPCETIHLEMTLYETTPLLDRSRLNLEQSWSLNLFLIGFGESIFVQDLAFLSSFLLSLSQIWPTTPYSRGWTWSGTDPLPFLNYFRQTVKAESDDNFYQLPLIPSYLENVMANVMACKNWKGVNEMFKSFRSVCLISSPIRSYTYTLLCEQPLTGYLLKVLVRLSHSFPCANEYECAVSHPFL